MPLTNPPSVMRSFVRAGVLLTGVTGSSADNGLGKAIGSAGNSTGSSGFI